ncbi:MAG: dihydrodipicolinate synthase family protein [Candidatus Abyssobacteria bacterium SURF_17]|uniref:Dihydrodipicolinate synthase family protein n=1 Tax=Candidatus Abyssobacteria bacterium SURF_17 TaxID=2093361 RepID=A0A419F9Q1_9BACT|nr:MAG: dihydrodipicolinate synthase family protein [Candidatus Abyssubacteria bacterium SURF_17]
MKPLEGIFVVMMSPFVDDEVDERAMRHMVNHFIAEGINGLVVLGSNGEFPYLSDEEKRQLIDIAVEEARGRVPVIIGTGYFATEPVIALTKYARDAGADAAMVALPVYYPLSFEDVKRHYKRISSEAGLPIVYYNIPDMTHLRLTPAEMAELATVEQIVGIKETIPDIDEMAEHVKLIKKKPFSVLSGTVLNLMPVMSQGGVGAICVLPNIVPKQCVEFYNAMKSGDTDKAGEIMAFLFKFMPLMTATPTPHAMMKESLRQLGVPITPSVKDPLPPLTDQQKSLVTQVLADAGLKK